MAFDNDAFQATLRNQQPSGGGANIFSALLGVNAGQGTSGLLGDTQGLMAANINGLGSIFGGSKQPQGAMAKALQQAWQDLSQMNKDGLAQLAQSAASVQIVSAPISTPGMSSGPSAGMDI